MEQKASVSGRPSDFATEIVRRSRRHQEHLYYFFLERRARNGARSSSEAEWHPYSGRDGRSGSRKAMWWRGGSRRDKKIFLEQ